MIGNHAIAGKYNSDLKHREQPNNETIIPEEPFLKANRFNPDNLKNPLRVEVDDSKFNTAYVFEAEGNKYLVLAMHWRISEKSRKWASNLLKTNKYGHDVHMIMTNYQAEYNDGNGLLGFTEFDIPNNTVRMMTMLTYARFKRFAPNWKAPDSKDLAHSEVTVLDKINASLAKWKGKESDLVPAKNEHDYKKASGTLAHWRFVGKEGQLVGNIEDISGNGNTLFFKKERGDLAQPDIFTKDHSPYSAAMGSVCRYSNNNSYSAPVSYWETSFDSELKLNEKQFESGFTIEYFIKLDKRFNGSDPSKSGTLEEKESSNKGMGILIREALRYEGADEPIFKNVISNLRELEYSSAPANSRSNKTSYSWSLGLNEWAHIAIVGDENGSQLYINGSTDMKSRDGALQFPGISNANSKPKWIIGALFDGRIHTDGGKIKDGEQIRAGVRNAFSGCIGEIRITDHKLNVSEFLTARK